VADYGSKMKAVRGEVRGVARFSPISRDRCELTLTSRVDAGGRIPVRVVNSKIPAALADAKILREKVQRDDEVDRVGRDELAGIVEREQQVYAEEEEVFVTSVQNKLGGFKEEDFKELDSPDHLVKMHAIFKAKGSTAIGRASTVRPPPPPPPLSLPPT
jgi:hypothetical protein